MSDIAYGGSGGSREWSSRAFPETPLHASSLATTPLEILDLNGDRFTAQVLCIVSMDLYT